ncbi:MAG: hypothetical protein MUE72_10040 [Chitinophagaceae bacterium]|nr:hypothetical protein [Chitinophagaceae bacterium]
MKTQNTPSFRLQLQKQVLQTKKLQLENTIQEEVKAFVKGINPIDFIKSTAQSVLQDRNVQVDASTMGINLGVNFIIEKILGRNRSIKGYISSMIMEKISSTFISKYMNKNKIK